MTLRVSNTEDHKCYHSARCNSQVLLLKQLQIFQVHLHHTSEYADEICQSQYNSNKVSNPQAITEFCQG